MRFKETRQEYTQGEALANRIGQGNLNNVHTLVGRVTELLIADESLDAILLRKPFMIPTTAQTAHPLPAALNLLTRLKISLKPVGAIGIIDHAGVASNDNAHLHRM